MLAGLCLGVYNETKTDQAKLDNTWCFAWMLLQPRKKTNTILAPSCSEHKHAFMSVFQNVPLDPITSVHLKLMFKLYQNIRPNFRVCVTLLILMVIIRMRAARPL